MGVNMEDVVAPPIILDRDGTIVIDRHYLGDPEGLEFLPGAAAGLRKLHILGCKLIVITNQSGIGRGLLTLEQVLRVNAGLKMMMDTIGAPLTATYFCPHAPDAHCPCRKPAAALLIQAAAEHDFEPSQAIVIGDKDSDIEMGKRVRAQTIRINSDHFAVAQTIQADKVTANLNEAATWISSRLAARFQPQ